MLQPDRLWQITGPAPGVLLTLWQTQIGEVGQTAMFCLKVVCPRARCGVVWCGVCSCGMGNTVPYKVPVLFLFLPS